jgi:hypothetical protein
MKEVITLLAYVEWGVLEASLTSLSLKTSARKFYHKTLFSDSVSYRPVILRYIRRSALVFINFV